MTFMPGLKQQTIRANGIRVNAWVGGEGDPVVFLRGMFRALCFRQDAIEEPMFAEYLRVFLMPGTIRAGLEDYRAAATVDIADDERDLGKKLSCPVLAIWGEQGKMHTLFDVLATWREKAADVRGHALPCGHFIPEEAPGELLRDLIPFLGQGR